MRRRWGLLLQLRSQAGTHEPFKCNEVFIYNSTVPGPALRSTPLKRVSVISVFNSVVRVPNLKTLLDEFQQQHTHKHAQGAEGLFEQNLACRVRGRRERHPLCCDFAEMTFASFFSSTFSDYHYIPHMYLQVHCGIRTRARASSNQRFAGRKGRCCGGIGEMGGVGTGEKASENIF